MDNLLAAAQKGGVGHVVILSIVGADQVPGLDCYRAKVLQEDILKAGPPGPTSSPSTNSAGPPSMPIPTAARSSPTTPPACSPPFRAMV